MHRPADSQLLTNLVTHEKDYAKSLKTLVSPSHMLSAHMAACMPPLLNTLLHVSAALGGADEALACYVDAVDECREHLLRIKQLEDELSVVVRDREILVTRLIKASKRSSNRDSVRLSSASTHSLSSGLSSSHVHSVHVQTTSKLGAAQAELQACEATLASKEQALRVGRVEALKAGLGLRCRALMECGWVWAEVGKSALQVLHDDDYGRGVPNVQTNNVVKPLPDAPQTYYIPPAHAISDSHPFPAQPRVLPRRITEETLRRQSSDEGGSSVDESETRVRAIDNPRYVADEPKTPERGTRKTGLLGRRTSSASGTRLFGGLKGLFGGGGGSPRSVESSPAFYEAPERSGGRKKKEWTTRTEKNLRDVERDMRAVGSARVASETGDVKRKLRKARAPGTEVAGAGLFAGTEIERRHLAAQQGRPRSPPKRQTSTRKPPQEYTISVLGSSDRRERTGRRASVDAGEVAALVQVHAPASVLNRPAVSPLRSALRNASRSPSPLKPAAGPLRSALRNTTRTPSPSSDSDNDVFFEADDGLQAEPNVPQRRKSVRVSLNPTFSAEVAAGDVWEDSSDEDEAYARARSLLTRR